jgi:integrase
MQARLFFVALWTDRRASSIRKVRNNAMVKHRKRGIKGAGSVYRRKSDGRWTGSFKLEGMDKPKYVYAPANNNTERAALALLQKAMQEYKAGRIKQTEKDQLLKDYLVNWFENVHKHTIYITTYARYRTHVYKHIIPGLGETPLRQLTAQQLQQFIIDKGNGGLSPSSIRGMCHLLHSALDNAVKWKLVETNVCDQVTLPKVEEYEGVILTREQIEKLIEVANTSEMGAFIKLGLMSGMRHGEMLALRWQDIDFETGVLSISHKVAYVVLPGYGFVEGGPKTKAGIRKIILPPFVLDALKTHREHQQVMREEAGDEWKEDGLIFCSLTGRHLSDVVNRKRFRNVLREAGLPEAMRVHDLRHNVATYLVNVLKYPPNFVQALLGHSNIAITLGMYVDKVDPEMLRPMMDDLNRLFGGKPEPPHGHDPRYHMAMHLADAFKYPPDFIQSLVENDPEALRRVMIDLDNLFGGK